MKVNVEIDPACKETEVVIRTSLLTDEIKQLVERLLAPNQKVLAGFQDGEAHLLEASELVRIYAVDKKVVAETTNESYTLRLRLYEVEESLDPTIFIRISHSELVNLKQIKKIDLSITGTIVMTLSNGKTAYASRRHVSKIRKILGI